MKSLQQATIEVQQARRALGDALAQDKSSASSLRRAHIKVLQARHVLDDALANLARAESSYIALSHTNAHNATPTRSDSGSMPMPEWLTELTGHHREETEAIFKRGFFLEHQIQPSTSPTHYEIKCINQELKLSRRKRKDHPYELQKKFTRLLEQYTQEKCKRDAKSAASHP